MCVDSRYSLPQLRLHAVNAQNVSSNWPNGDDDGADYWCFALSFAGRMVGYIVLLGVIVLIISLILKWLGKCSETEMEEAAEQNETSPLLPNKTVTYSYGACHQEHDLESGTGSSSSSNSSNSSNDQSQYDKKICVICYDEERDCFFVPCGHSATCQSCALRIFYEENRMCPVCRRYIGKVRKLST